MEGRRPVHGIRDLLQRLRKRQIVKWAIAYLAGAWLFLQLYDLVAEQFLMPVWVRQGATVVLSFGVLITLHSVYWEAVIVDSFTILWLRIN